MAKEEKKMGWLFIILDEKEEVAEVDAPYGDSKLGVDINTGEKSLSRCSVNVTYNYKRLLQKAGMKDGLRQYDDFEVNQSLVDELRVIEANLECMCAEVEPSNDRWNRNDPYNVLEFVRWFRDVAEELIARDGKFTCWVH